MSKLLFDKMSMKDMTNLLHLELDQIHRRLLGLMTLPGVIALLLCLFTLPSWAQSIARTVTVTGEGKVSVTPDTFHFSVSITEQGLHVAKLNKAMSQTSQRVVKLLLEHGVAKKDIQSLQVQLVPWYEYQNNSRIQKGFQLSRTIHITVRALNQFDQLIDLVLKTGANGVDGFRYSFSQPKESYLAALDLAVADAKQRAKRLAAQMQTNVGNVLSIREGGAARQPLPTMEKTMAFADNAGGFLPGEVEVTAQIEVIFELLAP